MRLDRASLGACLFYDKSVTLEPNPSPSPLVLAVAMIESIFMFLKEVWMISLNTYALASFKYSALAAVSFIPFFDGVCPKYGLSIYHERSQTRVVISHTPRIFSILDLCHFWTN